MCLLNKYTGDPHHVYRYPDSSFFSSLYDVNKIAPCLVSHPIVNRSSSLSSQRFPSWKQNISSIRSCILIRNLFIHTLTAVVLSLQKRLLKLHHFETRKGLLSEPTPPPSVHHEQRLSAKQPYLYYDKLGPFITQLRPKLTVNGRYPTESERVAYA